MVSMPFWCDQPMGAGATSRQLKGVTLMARSKKHSIQHCEHCMSTLPCVLRAVSIPAAYVAVSLIHLIR